MIQNNFSTCLNFFPKPVRDICNGAINVLNIENIKENNRTNHRLMDDSTLMVVVDRSVQKATLAALRIALVAGVVTSLKVSTVSFGFVFTACVVSLPSVAIAGGSYAFYHGLAKAISAGLVGGSFAAALSGVGIAGLGLLAIENYDLVPRGVLEIPMRVIARKSADYFVS